jgi:hypothetical protein
MVNVVKHTTGDNRLIALTPEIGCDQMAMDLPPVASAVFPLRDSRGVSDIPPRHPHFTKIS